MSRKSKIDSSEKVKIVEKCLNQNLSVTAAAKEMNVGQTSIRRWISIYETEGPTGLLNQERNRIYDRETKLSAVLDYLDGKGTEQEIAQKYGLRSTSQLRAWIKKYNAHEELNTRKPSDGGYMSKARQTSFGERLEIVQYCLDHDRNIGLAAKDYGCSYQQVRNWVLKFEEMGEKGLEDRRGKRAASQPARTQEEELEAKVAQMKLRIRRLEMENDLLKKVEELERGRGCH